MAGPSGNKGLAERIGITGTGRQLVHRVANIIFLGLKKAFDVTPNLDYSGPLYMYIESRVVYQVTITSVRWASLSVI